MLKMIIGNDYMKFEERHEIAEMLEILDFFLENYKGKSNKNLLETAKKLSDKLDTMEMCW